MKKQQIIFATDSETSNYIDEEIKQSIRYLDIDENNDMIEEDKYDNQDNN